MRQVGECSAVSVSIASFYRTLLSPMRHSLMVRSSAPDTMRGMVGWKEAQFTPRSCPSSTCAKCYSFAVREEHEAHVFDNCVAGAEQVRGDAARLIVAAAAVAALCVQRRYVPHLQRQRDDTGNKQKGCSWGQGQGARTRTLWSSDADSTRSSLGWKLADMT